MLKKLWGLTRFNNTVSQWGDVHRFLSLNRFTIANTEQGWELCLLDTRVKNLLLHRNGWVYFSLKRYGDLDTVFQIPPETSEASAKVYELVIMQYGLQTGNEAQEAQGTN